MFSIAVDRPTDRGHKRQRDQAPPILAGGSVLFLFLAYIVGPYYS